MVQTIYTRFAELEELCVRVDKTIIAVMPLNVYSRGCHLISTAAAMIFRNHGIDSAQTELVGLKRYDGYQTPHYVVRVGPCIFDFKRRVFVHPGTLIRSRSDIPGLMQSDGWYPDNKEYTMNATADTFTLAKYKTVYREFAACSTDVELCRKNWGVVQDCVRLI